MIEIACVELEKSSGMNPAVRDYLLRCFWDLEHGKEPNKVFGFSGESSGFPSEYWKAERDAQLAMGVQYWREQGLSRDQAVERVLAESSPFKWAGVVGESAIRSAYRKYFVKVDNRDS